MAIVRTRRSRRIPGMSLSDNNASSPAGTDGGGDRRGSGPLRRGWTTGACATAATRAAYVALLTGTFPDPVTIALPRGDTPSFDLLRMELGSHHASASIVKDAGDDPDVTHGAVISAEVRAGTAGTGVVFEAGPGVGTVTLPGLPIAPGEPAINPVPRKLMTETINEIAGRFAIAGDVVVRVSVDDGQAIAKQTWNPRLGIIGGLSILGTTGVVVPYSCAAWIHSIHRGIDVARASGLQHVAGATGATSEAAAQLLYGLPDIAMLDMGDFAGAMLKYLRDHRLPRVTIAGGFAKLAKLAAGHSDLHSSRSQVNTGFLAGLLHDSGAAYSEVTLARSARSAGEVLQIAGSHKTALAHAVAERAQQTAVAVLNGRNSSPSSIQLDVLVIDRAGKVLARSHGR